jgi:hypothetical protein
MIVRVLKHSISEISPRDAFIPSRHMPRYIYCTSLYWIDLGLVRHIFRKIVPMYPFIVLPIPFPACHVNQHHKTCKSEHIYEICEQLSGQLYLSWLCPELNCIHWLLERYYSNSLLTKNTLNQR